MTQKWPLVRFNRWRLLSAANRETNPRVSERVTKLPLRVGHDEAQSYANPEFHANGRKFAPGPNRLCLQRKITSGSPLKADF
jgi:hypothetical protein